MSSTSNTDRWGQQIYWVVFPVRDEGSSATEIHDFCKTLGGLEGIVLAHYYPDTEMVYVAYQPQFVSLSAIEAMARRVGLWVGDLYPRSA